MNTIVFKMPGITKKVIQEKIGFISEKICDYRFIDEDLYVFIEDDADVSVIEKDINNFIGKSINVENTIVYERKNSKKYYSDDLIMESGIVNNYYNTEIVTMNALGEVLFSFFDFMFKSFLVEYEYNERKYPDLLPNEVLQNTGYLETSPQYVMFCSNIKENIHSYEELHNNVLAGNVNESLEEPKFSLSPSACFHLYYELKNNFIDKPKIYTMLQSVFRNEGRFSWNKLARLRSYHVREIVLIGERDFIEKLRLNILDKTVQMLEKLNFNFSVDTASDHFIMPDMQKYRKLQKASKIKYEVRLNISEKEKISVASFNLHGVSFSKRFNFKLSNHACTESGCIGFGIERWIIAFLNQYGTDIALWPDCIKNYVEREKNNETFKI